MSNDDGADGTVQASALTAEEASECSGGLGTMGEGESAWQVGHEDWLCDIGGSTHITPSEDGMAIYGECNLKLGIADGSTRTIDTETLALSFGPETVSCKCC